MGDLLDLIAGREPQPNLQPAQQMPDRFVQEQILPQVHKGLFGIHGAARDILGTIGDAFLMANGGRGIYRQARDEEKLGDAMAGFRTNPQQAIEEAAKVNPDFARQLSNDYTAQQRLSQLQTLQEARLQAVRDKGRKTLGAFAGAIMKGAENSPDKDRLWKESLPQLQQMADNYGIDLGDLPLSYDDNFLTKWREGGINPDKQISLDYTGRNTDSQITSREAATRQGNARVSQGNARVSQGQQRIDLDRQRVDLERQRVGQGATRIQNTEKDRQYRRDHPPHRSIPHNLPPGFTLGKKLN